MNNNIECSKPLKDNDTIIYKMYHTDKVNIKNCKYILSQTDDEFINQFWKDEELDQSGQEYDLYVYLSQIRTFCLKAIDNKVKDKDFALIKQRYNYAKGSTNGRIYVSGFGVQSLQHNIRKFLTGPYLLDLDINNCHPCILLKIVEKYKDLLLSTTHLKEYVTNRQSVLKQYKLNKKDILIALNSDKTKSNNKFIKAFHSEKNAIFKKLIDDTDVVQKYNLETTNKKNPRSSLINKLLCIHENKLIHKQMSDEIIVPMFDGFMIEKENKTKYDKLLLEKGLIQWSYKDNISTINIDDWDDTTSLDYLTVKEKFQLTNASIKFPFKYVSKIKTSSGDLIDAFYSEADFSKLYRDTQVIQRGKETFIVRWLNDPDKRRYETIEFKPYKNIQSETLPKYIFNLFVGFPSIELDTYEDPKWFLDFLYYDIADECEGTYKYLLSYVAHIFQYPDVNPEIAIVGTGNTGTGKDTLVEIIECLMGKERCFVHRTADISEAFPKSDGGSFNEVLKNKIVLQLNESDGYDALKVKELIKDQVTRKYNNIKEKYMPPMKQKNYLRVIFLSNQLSPVNVEYNDRRLFMFKTSDIHKGNTAYWKEMYKNIYNLDVMNNLYSYLVNLDISEFVRDPENRPMTRVYENALECAVPIHARYLNNLFNSDEHNFFKQHPQKEHIYYTERRRLDLEYSNYLVDNHALKSGEFKSISFKKKLLDFKSIKYDKQIKLGDGHRLRVVEIDKNILLDELKKYNIKDEEVEDYEE